MRLKIDTTNVSVTRTRAAEPRTNFETGQPRVDGATGMPLWPVQVMALDESGGDVIGVTVAGEPNVSAERPVTVTGLVALPWSKHGRSGIAYRHAQPDTRCSTGAFPHEAADGEANR